MSLSIYNSCHLLEILFSSLRFSRGNSCLQYSHQMSTQVFWSELSKTLQTFATCPDSNYYKNYKRNLTRNAYYISLVFILLVYNMYIQQFTLLYIYYIRTITKMFQYFKLSSGCNLDKGLSKSIEYINWYNIKIHNLYLLLYTYQL